MFITLCYSEFGGAHVLGIFTTKLRANNRLKRVRGSFDRLWVEPIELNSDITIDIDDRKEGVSFV
jgi:hypothetical protein